MNKILILDKPFGISSSISLNSFTNGGKTRIIIVKTISDIDSNTKSNDSDLGILSLLFIWSHKLQTIFEITNEQIIRSIKSLNVHIIRDAINITVNLKYEELFNLK